MDKITKEIFEKWVQEANWFKVNEGSNTNGRQETFLTPAGSLIVVTYDLNGNLFMVGIIGPAPQQPQSPFLKGQPFIGKG